MSSSSPDSYKISLNIINAIKEHPVLYVPEIKGNAVKPQELRQKVWKRISNELGLEITWVKLRWKNLRDTYCRILKNRANGLKRKKWIFEKHLDFLKMTYQDNCNTVQVSDDYIKEMNSEDVKSNAILEQLEKNEEEDYNEFLEISKNYDKTMRNNQEQSNVLENDSESRKKHQAIKRPAVQECTKIDQNECQGQTKKKKKLDFDYDSSIDDFFQRIAQNVKKLPPKVQADVKMDVSKIVLEAEINYFKNNLLQKVQKYNNMPGMIKKLVLVPFQMIDNHKKTDGN